MKLRFFFLALMLVSLMACSLASCGKCEHDYEGVITKDATCTEDGTMTYTCKECKETYTSLIPATAHEYSAEYTTTPTNHYFECECGATSGIGEHISSGPATATKDEVCVECGYVLLPAVGVKFDTLTPNGDEMQVSVPNDTTTFSFTDEISCVGGATYILSSDGTPEGALETDTLTLHIGNNKVYIIEFINREQSAVYTIVIRRKPTFTLTFQTNGGSAVEVMEVEEGTILTPPTTTRSGYTFGGWSYDFSTPITKSLTINAQWSANTDTSYKVEYYLKNPGEDTFTLHKTENLSGTTDTKIAAELLAFDHFVFDASASVTEGTIRGDGTLVLTIYYTREQVSVSNKNQSVATINMNGAFDYGTSVELSVVSTFPGYAFIGWFSGDTLLSSEPTFTFVLDKNVEARFDVRADMAPFTFTSTADTCRITGVQNKAVTEIVVPDCVTSIAKGAFRGCSSLKKITLPFVGGEKFATRASETTLFGYIFGTSSYNGSTATSQIYTAEKFYLPTSLTSVTITGGQILYGAFYWCEKLTSITLGNGVSSALGDHAFTGCRSLTSLVLSENITAIGESTFWGCESLMSITIPAGVTSIGTSAFRNCYKLFSVEIPDAVTTIGEGAFKECKELRMITLGTGITSIGNDAFALCELLFYVNIKDLAKWCQISFSDAEANPLSIGCSLYINEEYTYDVVIPEGVSSIRDYAFIGCSSLKYITFPSTLTTIGKCAFESCGFLQNVTIPDSVTTLGSWAFAFCSQLTSAVIGRGITEIPESLFATCRQLRTITILGDITKISARAFFDCTALATIRYIGSYEQWSALPKGSEWKYLAGSFTVTYNYKEN